MNESNEIAGMQKLLEMMGREVLLLQNELDNKISNMSDRTLEMGQVWLVACVPSPVQLEPIPSLRIQV